MLLQWDSNNLGMYELNLNSGMVRELWPEAGILQG